MKSNLNELINVVHMLDPASYSAAAVAYTSGLDCQGLDEVLFVVQCGVFQATGDVDFHVEESSDDGSGDAYADVAGATISEKVLADDSATYCIRVDCRKRERYLRVGYDVDDDACIFGILAIVKPSAVSPAAHASAATVETSV